MIGAYLVVLSGFGLSVAYVLVIHYILKSTEAGQDQD